MKNKTKWLVVILIGIIILICYFFSLKNIFKKEIINIPETEPKINEKQPDIKKLKISAIGDCTLGWDSRYGYNTRFDKYFNDNNHDYGYYFAKVKDIFKNDDLTIANLEGTFTNYNVKVEKKFNFSAPPEYKNILTSGNIDIVSIGNNHTYDFGNQGYLDTKEALDSINIPYYGNETYLVYEQNGIKIGFFGLLDIYAQKYNEIDKAIKYLKDEDCKLIIASMHWGIEGEYQQSDFQEKMGRYMIDNGVDLVIGSHPHRMQGIEKYKDRYIIYSLANFAFGGNQNPPDKDTFIFQETFTFEDNKLLLNDDINIIPASVSSVKNTNNYQPMVLSEAEKERVLNKILKYSSGFNYTNIIN